MDKRLNGVLNIYEFPQTTVCDAYLYEKTLDMYRGEEAMTIPDTTGLNKKKKKKRKNKKKKQ